MKAFLSLAGLSALLAVQSPAQSTQWMLDKSHSRLGFAVTHLVISEVSGSFADYDVKVVSDKADFSDARVDLTADVKSINTENEQRDKHLRSDDFFNAEKFPTLTFKGTKLEPTGKNTYKLHGNLTIRDVTRPVVLDVTLGGVTKDPWGNTKAGFRVRGSVNRFDYNLKWNTLIEGGGLVVGETVDIVGNIQLAKGK